VVDHDIGGLVSLFAVRLVLGMGEGATLPAATGVGAAPPIVAFLSPGSPGVFRLSSSASCTGSGPDRPLDTVARIGGLAVAEN
jgi:hypothetical protein